MKFGICVCGLNGSGKTTLASALAEALRFRHMDAEDYYFRKSDKTYAEPRSREEMEKLLLEDIRANPCFVYSSVKGNVNAEINSHYKLIVYLDVPADIRMERIRHRAEEKFGNRVLPGGDLYEQEEKFFAFAAGRTSEPILTWMKTMPCRCISLDGRESVEANVRTIIRLAEAVSAE